MRRNIIIFATIASIMGTLFSCETVMAEDTSDSYKNESIVETIDESNETYPDAEQDISLAEENTDISEFSEPDERIDYPDESITDEPDNENADISEVPQTETEPEALQEENEDEEGMVGIDIGGFNLSLRSGVYEAYGSLPEETVTYKGQRLTKGKDYTVSVDCKYVETGSKGIFQDTLRIKGIGKYAGTSAWHTYLVSPAELNNVTVLAKTKSPSYPYTGWAREPKPVVTYKTNGHVLTNGKDYSLTFKNNKNVGKATVIIKGKGIFSGTASCTFKLVPIKITSANTTAKTKSAAYPYTGWARKPIPVVKTKNAFDKVLTLTNGQDFTLSYKNNKNAGTATVTVTGKGNYTGSISTTFKLTRANIRTLPVRFQNAKGYQPVKEGKIPIYFRTGKAVKPKVTLKYGDITLKEGVDYTLTYSNNIKCSDYRYDNKNGIFIVSKPAVVKITGKGNYSGVMNRRFLIDQQNILF